MPLLPKRRIRAALTISAVAALTAAVALLLVLIAAGFVETLLLAAKTFS